MSARDLPRPVPPAPDRRAASLAGDRLEHAARIAHTDAIVAARPRRRRRGWRWWALALAGVAFALAAWLAKG